MSIKSRRPPRGNTQRSGGVRRSSESGFAPVSETLRPESSEPTPPPSQASSPPAALENALRLPKASVLVGGVVDGSRTANDDALPDSSTRRSAIVTPDRSVESGATSADVSVEEEGKASAKALSEGEGTGKPGRVVR